MGETLDEIVAWIREVVQCYRRSAPLYNGVTVEGVRVCNKLDDIANRVEAATKRDHALLDANIARVRELEGILGDAANSMLSIAIKQKQIGNAAAMREALEVAKKAICHDARTKHTCDSLACENSTINANCGDILCGHRDLCEAKTAIQKALAAPPRNCDRFGGDIDKLREACARERGLNPEEDFPDVFPDWLLATVTTPEPESGGE